MFLFTDIRLPTCHGNAIEKARAGYLLETYRQVKDEKINEWVKYVQHGGSRKLDPEGPYRETFSGRWCLSLNVVNVD